MDKEMTGPAMEALVRACAEAVWQMYREPHNLTWDARKERTFESLAALVVGTQGTLLKLVRDARQRRYGGRRARGSNHTTACSIWGDDGLGGTGGQFPEPPPCNCGALENYQRARAEAAEAKVRDAEDAITMWESREAAFTSEGETFEQVIVNLRARVRDLEAAAGAARAEDRIRRTPIGGDAKDFCACGHHEMNHADYADRCRACNQTGCGCREYVSEPKGASK